MRRPPWGLCPILGVLFFLSLFSGCNGGGPVPSPTVEITPSPVPTLTPAPTSSPTPTPTATPTPTPIPIPVPPVHNITRNTFFSTIQAAIDGAQEGDEIVVSPGTYYEHIDFRGKNLVLRSEDPANPAVVASTIIDGGARGDDILIFEPPLSGFLFQNSVVTFCHGETRQAKLAGFTIQNGRGNGTTMVVGGGIYIKDASPVIERNVIRDNHAAGGGGIFVGGTSSPLIAYNTIQDNSAATSGGGIGIINASPIIHKNLFLNNRAQNAGGGIFVGHSASVRNITGLFWPRENCPPSGVNVSGTWTYQGNTFSGNTHQNGQDSDGAQVYFN